MPRERETTLSSSPFFWVSSHSGPTAALCSILHFSPSNASQLPFPGLPAPSPLGRMASPGHGWAGHSYPTPSALRKVPGPWGSIPSCCSGFLGQAPPATTVFDRLCPLLPTPFYWGLSAKGHFMVQGQLDVSSRAAHTHVSRHINTFPRHSPPTSTPDQTRSRCWSPGGPQGCLAGPCCIPKSGPAETHQEGCLATQGDLTLAGGFVPSQLRASMDGGTW